MMAEPAKTVRGEPGDYLIRTSYQTAHYVAPILCVICVIIFGWHNFFEEIHFRGSITWLCFGFAVWLIVLVISCAGIAWMFLGAIRISVSSDEFVVRKCLWGEVIFTSEPITLSNIKEAFLKEEKGQSRSGKWVRWVLIVHLADGEIRRAITFTDVLDANEFMNRFVR